MRGQSFVSTLLASSLLVGHALAFGRMGKHARKAHDPTKKPAMKQQVHYSRSTDDFRFLDTKTKRVYPIGKMPLFLGTW